VSLILVPGTVTAQCNGATQTVTNYQPGATVTRTTTVVRTQTDGAKTSYWTTTQSTQAVCHYPTSGSNPSPNPQQPQPTFCLGEACPPWWQRDSSRERRNALQDSNIPGYIEKRDLEERADAAIAATTVTVTQTTYTVTQTLLTTLPVRTTTEAST
jgi:hypothetical protein